MHPEQPTPPVTVRERLLSRRDLLAGLAGFALSARAGLAHALERLPARVRWDERFEAVIGFEINQAISRVHRPYVAVYVEDTAGNPVRTISLWVGRNGGGQWISDLRSWYRKERGRHAAGGPNVLSTVSGATRVAGVYSVRWDGRDDRNQLVEQGEYVLCIECNRQNGTYQFLRHPLTFGTTPFYTPIKGNYEIIGISVDFHQKR